jgi:hypothetical protein
LDNTPPLGWGYHPKSFGGKNMKMGRVKGGKCKKGRKGKEKRRNGKEKGRKGKKMRKAKYKRIKKCK